MLNNVNDFIYYPIENKILLKDLFTIFSQLLILNSIQIKV